MKTRVYSPSDNWSQPSIWADEGNLEVSNHEFVSPPELYEWYAILDLGGDGKPPIVPLLMMGVVSVVIIGIAIWYFATYDD